MGTRINANTGQIEGQPYAAQHQVGTAGRINAHVQARAETAYQYSHDNRAACQPHLYRTADTRHAERHGTQHQSQHDADENGGQIGFAQCGDGVAQYAGHALDGRFFAHHRQPVA